MVVVIGGGGGQKRTGVVVAAPGDTASISAVSDGLVDFDTEDTVSQTSVGSGGLVEFETYDTVLQTSVGCGGLVEFETEDTVSQTSAGSGGLVEFETEESSKLVGWWNSKLGHLSSGCTRAAASSRAVKDLEQSRPHILLKSSRGSRRLQSRRRWVVTGRVK